MSAGARTERYLINIYIRLGHVTYTTVAVSRRPSSRWAADAAEVTADEGAVFHVSPTWRLWWGPGVGGAGRSGRRSCAALRFRRPCDYAATSSSSSSTMTCPRSSSSSCAPATCTRSWTGCLCARFCATPGAQFTVVKVVRGAEAVSHGAVQQTTEILQLQSIDKVSMSLLCRSSKFSSADGEETVELPQLQLDIVVHMPVVVQPQMPMVQTSENCESPAVAVHLNVVVDVPVVQVLLAKFIDSSSPKGGYGGGDGVFFVFSSFSRSSRLSGVERQFLESSMAKSSLPSTFFAQIARTLLTQTLFLYGRV